MQDIENGEDMVVESNVAHQSIEGPCNPVVYRNQNKRGRELMQSPAHEFMGDYKVKRQRMVQPQMDSSMNVQVPSSNQAFFRNTTGWFWSLQFWTGKSSMGRGIPPASGVIEVVNKYVRFNVNFLK